MRDGVPEIRRAGTSLSAGLRDAGDRVSAVSYIANNPAFEGIGRLKAQRLWERHGEALYGLLDAGDASVFVSACVDKVK